MRRLGRSVLRLVAIGVGLGVGASGGGTVALAEETWAGTSFEAAVEQPRSYGYQIGDLLAQRVLLRVEGDAFTPAALPQPGRFGAWFERRRAAIDVDSRGERWLDVEYQVINSPPALTVVQLPSWKMAPAAGDRGLRVDPWPISIGPVSPRDAEGASKLGGLRPDRHAGDLDLEAIERRLVGWGTAALAACLAWLGWWAWRNRREAVRLPFAHAMRELHRAGDSVPDAWRILHRAFDRTAGCAMASGTLPRLFDRAPQFLPLRGPIEAFYAQSSRIFFGSAATGDAASVRELCQALYRVERRTGR